MPLPCGLWSQELYANHIASERCLSERVLYILKIIAIESVMGNRAPQYRLIIGIR